MMRIEVGHEGSRIRWVEREIFLVHFAPDCMTHECRCRDENDRVKLDACCQHGVDVDLAERDVILGHAAAVAAILDGTVRDEKLWFDDSAYQVDPDFPSGAAVRTAVVGEGCVFLSHDGRGCGLHRAALAGGFAPEAIKPAVCSLYPLAYGEGNLGLSNDFSRYSCADADGPTVYRLQRSVIADVFGAELVAQLDLVEAQLARRRLAVATR